MWKECMIQRLPICTLATVNKKQERTEKYSKIIFQIKEKLWWKSDRKEKKSIEPLKKYSVDNKDAKKCSRISGNPNDSLILFKTSKCVNICVISCCSLSCIVQYWQFVLSKNFVSHNWAYIVPNVSNSKYILKHLPFTLPSLVKPMEIELTPDTLIIISVLLGTVPQYLVPWTVNQSQLQEDVGSPDVLFSPSIYNYIYRTDKIRAPITVKTLVMRYLVAKSARVIQTERNSNQSCNFKL